MYSYYRMISTIYRCVAIYQTIITYISISMYQCMHWCFYDSVIPWQLALLNSCLEDQILPLEELTSLVDDKTIRIKKSVVCLASKVLHLSFQTICIHHQQNNVSVMNTAFKVHDLSANCMRYYWQYCSLVAIKAPLGDLALHAPFCLPTSQDPPLVIPLNFLPHMSLSWHLGCNAITFFPLRIMPLAIFGLIWWGQKPLYGFDNGAQGTLQIWTMTQVLVNLIL